MTANRLFRLAGLAAVLGGALRVIAALPLGLGGTTAEALYDVIDVLLLLGVIGIYVDRAAALGIAGLLAFVVAVASLSFIGGPDADPFGFSTYQLGGSVLALAMAGLSVAWLVKRQRPTWPALAWLGSLVVGAAAGALPAGVGFAIAGALFGAGFVVAGVELVRR